jgi:TATA-binding protein-associated factor Taf7
MAWPWSPPRPKVSPEEAAQQARRQEIRRRVELLADEIQRLAERLENHKQRNHGGPPWPKRT